MATADGRYVRTGQLFRCGQLNEVDAAAAAHLRSLGLQLVADLRHPDERARAPSFWADDYAARILMHDHGGDQSAPHVSFFRPGMTDQAAVDRRYGEFYRDLPFHPAYRPLFAKILRRIADDGAPLLIHCSAGKDRTGLLVALILSILDVPLDAIIGDYLLSKEAMRAGTLRAQLTERAAQEGGIAPDDQIMDAVLGVKPDYLRASFAAIDAQHGSLTAYLDAIGIDAAVRAALVDLLVAEG